MPKGFLTRLICRQHHRIFDQQVWNNAVIFGEKDGATVLAYETYEQNKIELIAEGAGKAQLLNETIQQLDAIHKDSKFRNLQVKKRVPCPCRVCKGKEKPYYFDYAYLQGKILRGAKRVECQNLFDDVPIREILKEISIFSVAQIKEHLAVDKIEEALNLLKGQFEDDKEVIAATGELRRTQIEFLANRISYNDYQIVKNKKILLILEMLNG